MFYIHNFFEVSERIRDVTFKGTYLIITQVEFRFHLGTGNALISSFCKAYVLWLWCVKRARMEVFMDCFKEMVDCGLKVPGSIFLSYTPIFWCIWSKTVVLNLGAARSFQGCCSSPVELPCVPCKPRAGRRTHPCCTSSSWLRGMWNCPAHFCSQEESVRETGGCGKLRRALVYLRLISGLCTRWAVQSHLATAATVAASQLRTTVEASRQQFKWELPNQKQHGGMPWS